MFLVSAQGIIGCTINVIIMIIITKIIIIIIPILIIKDDFYRTQSPDKVESNVCTLLSF